MSTSRDDRSGLDSAGCAVKIDLYISKSTNAVQHPRSGLSSAASVEAAPENLRFGPAFFMDVRRGLLVRAMLQRPVPSGLIETIFDLDSEGVRDLAADLDLPAPPSKRVMFSDDSRLTPGALSPPSDTPLRFYTRSQLRYLMESWLGEVPIEIMAATLGRSAAALKRKFRALGLFLRQRTAIKDALRSFQAREGDPCRHLPSATPPPPAPRDWRSLGVTPAPPPARSKRTILLWPAHRTKELCVLWLNGLRPGEIAHRIGGSSLSISTKAHRLSLPGRLPTKDDRLALGVTVTRYICFDPVHDEYFWSPRQSARQSSYRTKRAACAAAA